VTISCPKYLTEEEMWFFYTEEARRLLRVALADENYTVKQLNAALQQKETNNG